MFGRAAIRLGIGPHSSLPSVTDDRQTTDGRVTAYSECEFTFAKNVEIVNDLVTSQEDKPQTHSPVREISRRRIHRCTQNAICLHFLFPYLLNICSKFEFTISEGSVATCLR